MKNHLRAAYGRSYKKLLPQLVLAVLTSYLLCLPFALHGKTQIIIVAACSIAVGYSYSKLLKAKVQSDNEKSYVKLLSFISSRLYTGSTLEKAFADAAFCLASELSPKNRMLKALQQFHISFLLNVNFAEAIKEFCLNFNYDPCTKDLSLLPQINRYGGDTAAYIREKHREINNQQLVQKSIKTEFTSQISEAVIMGILPFPAAMVFITKQSASNHFVHVVCGILALMSVLIICICFNMLSNPKRQTYTAKKIHLRRHAAQNTQKHRSKSDRQIGILRKTPGILLKTCDKLYMRYLPQAYGSKVKNLVCQDDAASSTLWQKYLREKFLICGLGFCLALFICICGFLPVISAFLCLPPLFFLNDWYLLNSHKDDKLVYTHSSPLYLSSLLTLLKSGLTLDKAMSILAMAKKTAPRKVSNKKSNKGSIASLGDLKSYNRHTLHQQMNQAAIQINLGYSEDKALREIAERSPVPEIQSGLLLLARYGKEGSEELLNLLQITVQNTWQLYKDTEKKYMTRHMLKLLPLTALDLLIIISIIIIPFIQKFIINI